MPYEAQIAHLIITRDCDHEMAVNIIDMIDELFGANDNDYLTEVVNATT